MIVEVWIKMARPWTVTPLPMDLAISRLKDSSEYDLIQRYHWWVLNEEGNANVAEIYHYRYFAVKFDATDDDFVWMKMSGWTVCEEGKRDSVVFQNPTLIERAIFTPVSMGRRASRSNRKAQTP